MNWNSLTNEELEAVQCLLVLLRLAVLLSRDRSDNEFPIKSVTVEDKTLALEFSKNWLDEFPLTRIDLEQESEYLKAIDFKLSF